MKLLVQWRRKACLGKPGDDSRLHLMSHGKACFSRSQNTVFDILMHMPKYERKASHVHMTVVFVNKTHFFLIPMEIIAWSLGFRTWVMFMPAVIYEDNEHHRK